MSIFKQGIVLMTIPCFKTGKSITYSIVRDFQEFSIDFIHLDAWCISFRKG